MALFRALVQIKVLLLHLIHWNLIVCIFSGLTLMNACITYFELAMYGVCAWAFILAIIVLILVIHTKRQQGNPGGSRKKGGKKPKGGRKGPPNVTKKGWA